MHVPSRFSRGQRPARREVDGCGDAPSEGRGRAVCICPDDCAAAERPAKGGSADPPERPDKNGWHSEELIGLRAAQPHAPSGTCLVSPERKPAVEDSHHNKNQRATQVPSQVIAGVSRKLIPHRRPAGVRTVFKGAGVRDTNQAAAACTCAVATSLADASASLGVKRLRRDGFGRRGAISFWGGDCAARSREHGLDG